MYFIFAFITNIELFLTVYKNLLNFVNNRAHDYQVVSSFNNFTSTYSFTNENIL